MVADKGKLKSAYNDQDRGEEGDYDRYFAGMDATMKQKLAFLGAHFLMRPGAVIADMGCGSGLGSFQLAQLNPHIRVVGIDINEEAVKLAQEKYRLPNLQFAVGDIEKPDPALGPFDGILNSSVLHHVYTFNGYDTGHVINTLKNQFESMSVGGQMVIRDFAAGAEDAYCILDLSAKGTDDTIKGMSDADLLVEFSKTAKPLTPEKGTGFFLEELDCPHDDMRRFRLSAKWLNEFALHKDYRADWDVEVLEEYSFWSQKDFQRELSALGGRVVYTAPFWNSWIVENRFRGKLNIYDENGKPLDFPPTNFIAVVEKVSEGSSLHVGESTLSQNEKSFLSLKSYQNKNTGEIYDMVKRPGEVRDYVPYKFGEDKQLHVYAKHGYPRPLANTVPRSTPSLDQKSWSGHMVEAISFDSSVTEAQRAKMLAARLGAQTKNLGQSAEGLHYYPSPGLCDEYVESEFVEVKGLEDFYAAAIDPAISGFSTAGEVRSYRAQDILRAAQVGMLPEARLEMNTYRLMQQLGETPDVWIGSEMLPATDKKYDIPATKLKDILDAPPVAAFAPSEKSAGYVRHIRSSFSDAAEKHENARQEFEFVIPGAAGTGTNVASALPIARGLDGEWYVGLEYRDLPAPQQKEGNSHIPVAPAYRLPNSIGTLERTMEFVAEKFNVGRENVRQLGEGYFSSLGITPERVFPFVVEVDPEKLKEKLQFVPLRDLFSNMHRLRDGHLMIVGMRGVHALGVWNEYAPKPAPKPAVAPEKIGSP